MEAGRGPGLGVMTDTVESDSQPDQASAADPAPSRVIAPPVISLPKGGGAIRGMGEKFGANPVTGTASMAVPISTSPGRSGFGPELSLTYDSGSGNGVFGFGWTLALPSITRKTDKGLPRYRDHEDSDVYIISGSEDLVPLAEADDTTTEPGYAIRRYRPRIEGLFARIERWTTTSIAPGTPSSPDIHWRSISRENVLTVYGKDARSRIADPLAPGHVFSWLICETRDDKANGVVYDYKPEDGIGVTPSQVHERNRGAPADPRRTANRYLKRIRYGNRAPLIDAAGVRPRRLTDPQVANAGWMFEIVLDYGEHGADAPGPNDAGPWAFRADPFSSYRSTFEIRTTRICQRVLMFHHIPDLPTGEPGYEGLVSSTDFMYTFEADPTSSKNPVYSFMSAVTHHGYRLDGATYIKGSMPPLEFAYSEAVVDDALRTVPPEALVDAPSGLGAATWQWFDLHGEGAPGMFSEHGDRWFYKRNLSPLRQPIVEFAPIETIESRPSVPVSSGGGQFMDLAGDGGTDLALLSGSSAGVFEHDEYEGWESFHTFTSQVNRDFADPNLRLVDLDGDGHADVLISEEDAFVWHASLAEDGFGPAIRISKKLDEEKGPRLVFADPSVAVHLADMSGDGLADLVRIRRHDIAYWPNLGYGRFGAKVTMSHPPPLDRPDGFMTSRLRLADVDGSGTTDLIYLAADGASIYFNQAGNGWSDPVHLSSLPTTDTASTVMTADLLGNGTACLLWTSPLPGENAHPMRYVSLMGTQKPHLLISAINNLGAETHVHYATSTKFYLQDRAAGRPWVTRLPFPVHVVESIETIDVVSRNRFVTRYAYHHGHFDREEREFRGFASIDRWDTEELGALSASGTLSAPTNLDPASHVPPVMTRTWFHTGADLQGDSVSAQLAHEYYREPGLNPDEVAALLLPDTILPPSLTLAEEREARRALKGSILREEVYALDGSDKQPHPYSVTEQNFTIRREQPRGNRRHAVFFAHPRESLRYHYERSFSLDLTDPEPNPAKKRKLFDPRVEHELTLEANAYGDVTRSLLIAYGRRRPDPTLLAQADRDTQSHMLVKYVRRHLTNPIDDTASRPDRYRTPLPAETRTYELTGLNPLIPGGRFTVEEWTANGFGLFENLAVIGYHDPPIGGSPQRRVIECIRTLYRPDDLGAATSGPLALLPLGSADTLALHGETYRLAFNSAMLASAFVRNGQALLPNPAATLGVGGPTGGGYVQSQTLKALGRFPATDPDDEWWVPGGRTFLSPTTTDTAVQERASARAHFFLSTRARDSFHTATTSTERTILYDAYDLLVRETRDAVGNVVTAGERLPTGVIDPSRPGNDYRVLQPSLVMDPNGNRTELAFDVRGLVVGTAVMGKPGQNAGDSLAGFVIDLTEADVVLHLANPSATAGSLLGRATTRIVYDPLAYFRTRAQAVPQAVAAWVGARVTHDADLGPGESSRVRHTISYSDGFGREVQRKALVDPGSVALGGPVVDPRWVASGWITFNNKGHPVREFEPFFSASHAFEFGVQVGVSPILFYDPLGRVVVKLHPDHTYEKVTFDPWSVVTSDVNDTVLGDPRTDGDTAPSVSRYFASQLAAPPYETWYARRISGSLGAAAQAAAAKTAAHATTPTRANLDVLGRPFMSVRDAGPGPVVGALRRLAQRFRLDIQGNRLAVRDPVVQAGDPLGRVIEGAAFDMAGSRLFSISMESGSRWTLTDAAGKALRRWDSRDHTFELEYDPLRRQIRSFVTGADPAHPANRFLTDRWIYGEQHPDSAQRNLRGALYLHLDPAGALAMEARDFTGHVLRMTRRIASEYRAVVDWLVVDSVSPTAGPLNLAIVDGVIDGLVEPGVYTTTTKYDALSRPTLVTTPHTPTMQPSVIRSTYGDAGLVNRLDVNVRGTASAGVPTWMAFVTNVEYDAKGRRQRLVYGNGVTTIYEYEPDTFRLARLRTRRDPVVFPDDCPTPAPAGWPGCDVQNLTYAYDPTGNVMQIRDDAQQTIYFRNQRVEPSLEFTYDPLYRLVEATGREHLGQVGGSPAPHSSDDGGRARLAWAANDGFAMGTYVEHFRYDQVGNLLEMKHVGADPANAGWTRTFAYDEISLIENGLGEPLVKQSNRLTSTRVDAGPLERLVHDPHGNVVRMPHLGAGHPTPNLDWDYRDRLHRADLGGGGTAWFVHDGSGERLRKVWEKSANLVEERLYLGGFEIYRRKQGAQRLERETLDVALDGQRLALVETRTMDTAGTDQALAQVVRYQLGNHLGSTLVELDENAAAISYEEYTPFGSSSYQAVRSTLETPKRYRFTSRERDEETGLYSIGLRLYTPWLGRWISCDQSGPASDLNLYAYVGNQPVNRTDPDGRSWRDFAKGVLYGAGTALVIAGAIALAPITIPAAVVTGAVVVGVGASSYTLVQSARQRNFYNQPISREEADYQAGNVVGGLVVAAASGPIAGGMSRAATTVQEGTAALASSLGPLPATGATAVTAVTPVAVSQAAPAVAGLATAALRPALMSMSNDDSNASSSSSPESPEPYPTSQPAEPATSQPVNSSEANMTPAAEPSYTPNPNIRPYGQQPRPRPPGMDAHHPERKADLRAIANYDLDADPTLLVSRGPHRQISTMQATQATQPGYMSQLGSAASIEQAAQNMSSVGVNPATAGQAALEHASYLFSITPANEVMVCLPK
jgi:RHS repeat-associated protein